MDKALDALAGEADRVITDHWKALKAMEAKQPDKSVLNVRVRRRGRSITFDWFGVEWRGPRAAGTRRALKVTINKGKGHAYPMRVLLQWAQPWEADLVKQTEAELAKLRAAVAHINKAIRQVRFADMALKARHVKDW